MLPSPFSQSHYSLYKDQIWKKLLRQLQVAYETQLRERRKPSHKLKNTFHIDELHYIDIVQVQSFSVQDRIQEKPLYIRVKDYQPIIPSDQLHHLCV